MTLNQQQLEGLLHRLSPKVINNTNLEIDCPECGHRECSISFKEQNNPWGCYRQKKCGERGNIYTLIKYGFSIKKEDKIASNFKKRELKVFAQQEEDVYLPNINLPLGYKRLYQDDYMTNRGFTDKDYKYWEVGRTSLGAMKKYLIFPIEHNGERKAYVGRSFIDDLKPKYKNSISEFSSLLGGYDKFDSAKTVILVEGVFDLFNVTRLLNLYEDEDLSVVCTFGAKISKNQISLLSHKKVENVILFFDNDVIKKIKPASFELALYFNTSIMMIEDVGIDAGDCNINQLLSAYESRSSPIDFYLNRL